MVSAETFATDIESKLNAIVGSSLFKIKANVGDFEEAMRDEFSNTINTYINGVLKLGDADRIAIKGIQAYNQSLQLEIVVDCNEKPKTPTSTDYPQVDYVESILQEFIQDNNANAVNMTDENGVSYEVTTNYGGVTVGGVEVMSPLGQITSLFVYATMTIVESGINTNRVEWYINNERVICQNYSCTRKRELESNMPYGNNSTLSQAQSNGLSITLIKPMLNNSISRLIEKDLYEGVANTCYLVTRKRGNDIENSYTMLIAENSESGEVGANIGSTISLTEGAISVMSFDNFDIHSTLNIARTIDLGTSFTDNKYYDLWLWWGNKIYKTFVNVIANTTTIWNYGESNKYITISINSSLDVLLDFTHSSANDGVLVLGDISLGGDIPNEQS